MARPQETRVIRVSIDTKGAPGLKQVSNQLTGIGRSAHQTAGLLGQLRNAFGALAGLSVAGFGVRELARASDEIQLLRDRIAVFEGSTEAANIQLEKLSQVADETAAPLSTLGVAYNRLAISLSDLNIRGDALLDVVQGLQQTFRLAGATIGETRGALIQLSQGLGAGQLRGQELRSVLEANAVFAQLLAQKVGVATGDLIRFAEAQEGIAASVVLETLSESFDELDRRAKTLSLTIEQSVALAFNKFQLALLRVNEEFSLTQGFGKTLNLLVNNSFPLTVAGLTGITLALLNSSAAASAATATFGALSTVFFTIVAAFSTGGLLGLLKLAGGALVGLGTAAFTVVAPIVAVGGALAALIAYFIDSEKTTIFFKKALLTIEGLVNDFLLFITEKVATTPFLNRLLGGEPEKQLADLKTTRTRIESELSSLSGFLDTLNERRRGEALAKAVEKMREQEKANRLVLDSAQKLNFAYKNGIITLERYREAQLALERGDLEAQFNTGKIFLDEYNKRLEALLNPTAKASERFAQINAEFNRTGDIQAYGDALAKLEFDQLVTQLDKGKISLSEFSGGIDALNIKDLNRDLANGNLNLRDYNSALEDVQIEQVTRKFKEGTIGLKEFDEQIISTSEKFRPGSAFRSGLQDYISSAGTLSQNVAESISKTFTRLEDSFLEFIQTGKFNFRQFTLSILEDLNRIIIRQALLRPLAGGILGGLGVDSASAKGNVFDRSGMVTKFATGGVVDSPTLFGYGGGKTGLMGEAGPEAIVPLKRGRNGELGVQATQPNVNINIVNNAGVEIESRETVNDDGERSIDLIIVGRVKQALDRGVFDRQFESQYGIRRRGV